MNATRDPKPDMTPPAAFEPVSSLPRERMMLLFMVMMVTAAGNTAMQSVMPSIGTALKLPDVWVSLAYSWSAVLWVGFAPFWARRSDRRGRKAMMALGLGGFSLSFALCGGMLWLGLIGALPALVTIGLFALARGTYGAFGSAAPPAVMAYIASRTAPAERTRALSLVASSFSLGTVIGPAVAPLLILPGLGLIGPYAAFALLGLLVLMTLHFRLPQDQPAFAARGPVLAAPFAAGSDEAFPDEATGLEQEETQPAEGDTRLAWRDKRIRPWIVAGLLGGHAQAAIVGIAGFLILDRLDMRTTPADAAGPIGTVLMCGAIATLLVQWGIIPSLKLGPRVATLGGIAIALVGLLVFAVAGNLHAIALGYAIASAGFGMFRPGFFSGASLSVSRAEQGQVSGIIAAVNGAAYIFAPALGVWLYNHSEPLAFGLTGLTCLAVLALGWRGLSPDATLQRE